MGTCLPKESLRGAALLGNVSGARAAILIEAQARREKIKTSIIIPSRSKAERFDEHVIIVSSSLTAITHLPSLE